MGHPYLCILISISLAAGLSHTLAFTGCGKPVMSDRIVGGQDSVYGEWPWQVSLRKNGYHICGGSLINTQWVVSAAHCFKGANPASDYMVNLGAYQLSSPRGIMVPVKEIHIHPTFKQDGSSGDIALLKLQNPIQYSDYILPICIPTPDVVVPTNYPCTVTGWGSIKSGVGNPTPQTLQKVQLPIIDHSECDAMYHIGNPSLPQDQTLIQWDMICAGYKEGGKDACQGDSGGPLVCLWDGTWLLTGIVSWGFGCADPNRPGVYTRVTAYSDWIKQLIPDFVLTYGNVSLGGNPGKGAGDRPCTCISSLLILFFLRKLL